MKHTFYLKEAKSIKETLIYFSCYFKKEAKKFVYSTGETILPNEWDKKNNRPFSKGKNKAKASRSIQVQLDRYSHKFTEVEQRMLFLKENFTTKILKSEFDKEFKKERTKSNHFFSSYNQFVNHHKKMNLWADGTIKKYITLKNILAEFEQIKNYKLTFSKINNSFLSEFTDFCYDKRDHSTNTFRRNLGLFKTFMKWAYTNRLTYNNTFESFQKPKAIVPKMVALSLIEIEQIANAEMENEKLTRVRDVFVFQCLTGMRFNELKRINKANIQNGHVVLKETKDINKVEREIPLSRLSTKILKKHKYSLPLISNQKYNDYIKKVIEKSEINYNVEVSRIKGKTQTFEVKKVSDLISSHTARSSFITNMKNNGVPDKTIMSITGHKDLKTFMTYYRVNDVSKKEAVAKVFGKL